MIQLSNISLNFGSKILYENASLLLRPGEKCGLVGPNGMGKTTLFRLITKDLKPNTGEVSVPNKITLGYFSQEVGDMAGNSILEEVKKSSKKIDELAQFITFCEAKFEQLGEYPLEEDELTNLLEKYGEAQQEFERFDGYNRDHIAERILTGLGISPNLHNNPIESLSGGWKMRVELAKILLLNPDVLLMDEPTNHLDVESIVWLEEWLKKFKGCLLMTSHDREFMNRIVSRIYEVDNKTINNFTGNYDFYEKEKEIRKEQLLASHKRQQEMLAKEEEFIAKFAARASHAAQVNSRVKKLEKIDRIEIPREAKVIKFEFAEPPRSGEDVIVLNNASKSYTHQIFGGITATISRLSKVGLVGVNGAGKSTLLKSIVGQVELTSGFIKLGANVNVGYFSQHSLDLLDISKTVFESISEVIPRASIGTIKSLLGSFLFSDDDADKQIKVLSGGEKSRVLLARILALPVNLLILDEPTNHLDIKSRDILLNALKNFIGTIVIVSHDRYFMKELVNRVFEIDKGSLRIYEGRYDEYLEKCEIEQKNLFYK